MSDLDNAINSINASAAKAENTATFLDDMSTFDDQSSVTNPNNGQTVASIPKQVKDRTDELFTAAESDINQAVSDAAQSATDAQDAADSIGRYQGLWPDSGGIADKGDTYQTQAGGSPTGQYFTALQNTTVDPVGDDVYWREVIGNQSLGGLTSYQANTVADMVAGVTLSGNSVNISIGQVWTTIAYKAVIPLKPLGGGSYFIVSSAAYGSIPDGNIDHYVGGGTSLVAVLIHDNEILAEQAGITPILSDATTRDNNDSISNAILDIEGFKTIRCNESSYYFGLGISMQTDARAKAWMGAKGNTPSFFYFNQVIERNIPTARRSTLSIESSLLPENEPTRTNTAICYGTKTQQVGRVQFENIRPVNDSAADTFTNKLSRVGTGLFLNSGFSEVNRIVTEGWHVGSYEVAFVTNRGMVEHIASNIMFVFAGGTSSTLSGYFANGTNYDSDTDQFTVTYTSAEEDEFQGFGFLFNNLFYSNFNSLAADKIQNGYGIFGRGSDYRTSYEFIGCGSEFVEKDFVIEDPSATVDIHGGQDWGLPEVKDANKVNVYNRRFPAIIDPNLSAGVVTVDGQTFELQNPVELAGQQASAFEFKGYNGLSYTRVKVDQFFKYWRIKGRLEVNEFEMRKNIPVNGALTGDLKFYGLDMTSISEFNGAMGKVQVNTIRFSSTNLRQAIIDSTLTGVSAIDGGPSNNYFVVTKQALTDPNHKFVVEVDLELKTAFTGDLSKKSTRPDDVTFKGIDY